MDIISKKTRSEFKEYFVTITLREIESYFDNHNVPCADILKVETNSGQRRTLVEKYYQDLDWSDSLICRQILNVYEDVLNDLVENKYIWNAEQNKVWFTKLHNFIIRDGYNLSDGKIVSIGQTENFEDLQNATNLLDKTHFKEYIERIKKSIIVDPTLAIGSTKELVESTLKTILNKSKIEFDKNDDIPKLLKMVQKTLKLVPDEVDESKKGSKMIKILLSNLSQVVIKLAELRNLYGTGHGKEKVRNGLTDRHAKLVVGAGVTLSTFLLETFEYRRLE